EQAGNETNEKVSQEPDAADDEQARKRPLSFVMCAREFNHVTETMFRINGLGKNHVGPCDRVHHAEAIEDLRQCRWDQYGPDYLSLRRTESQSRLDQLLRHQSNGRHYDRQQINEDAE